MSDKILKLFCAFFIVNSLLIFLLPVFMGQAGTFSLSFTQQSAIRQTFLMLSAAVVIVFAQKIKLFLIANAEKEEDAPQKIRATFTAYLVAFCLYEAVVIVGMVSFLTWGDSFSYLVLGYLGLSRLIKEAINIRALA